MRRWRGLVRLAADAVVHGSAAIERVQRDSVARPFAVLEHVPPIAGPARQLHIAHDLGLAATYGSIRAVTRAVAAVADAVLAQLEADRADPPGPAAQGRGAAEAAPCED